ncbi:MAG: GNAT family N-acetyltransferase [Bacteroidota bacterium]
MRFDCKAFDQLQLKELYEILRLRQEVFVVEQNCPYLDADRLDYPPAMHLMGWDEETGDLLAYARLLPPGISYAQYASIGRVITSPLARGKGLGKVLMNESIKRISQLFNAETIKISAQCYLIKFYEGLGFKTIGESYLEDDIPHIAMVR